MNGGELAARFRAVRRATVDLVRGLDPEDLALQSMPDASPAKWHLAHTTWFFETFYLAPRGEAPFDPRFGKLFNSYYETVGDRHPRAERGLLSRPALADVLRYRSAVDERVLAALATEDETGFARVRPLLELGIAHEEQHQELLLTDLLHLFSRSSLEPVVRPLATSVSTAPRGSTAPPPRAPYTTHDGGRFPIGADGKSFAFDNEGPAHDVWLSPFSIASRLVTFGEFAEFVQDGGYERPELWLSDGLACMRAEGWIAPLYVAREGRGGFRQFTLHGARDVSPDTPVTHVSFYEADAYARWAGARLPTEFEWEVWARASRSGGHFADSGVFAPHRELEGAAFGTAWVWTQSAYTPYPRYRAPAGALGEYNGKFMVNQIVLRGGSCLTPPGHVRPTYRNFFPPTARWQMTGIRLAKDAP